MQRRRPIMVYEVTVAGGVVGWAVVEVRLEVFVCLDQVKSLRSRSALLPALAYRRHNGNLFLPDLQFNASFTVAGRIARGNMGR
jgi:hypothetical protein